VAVPVVRDPRGGPGPWVLTSVDPQAGSSAQREGKEAALQQLDGGMEDEMGGWLTWELSMLYMYRTVSEN